MLLSLFKVKGHSMEPSMKDGSFFIASNIPSWFTNPKPGDRIVFQSEEKIIVKKIIKIDNEKYYLSGENKSDDKKFPPIGRSEILGKVIIKL